MTSLRTMKVLLALALGAASVNALVAPARTSRVAVARHGVMDKKKIILLVGALFVAAVTALLAKNMFDGASAPQVEAKKATTT